MNGVDIADQRRASYTTHRPARRNWVTFFFAFLDISISNAYILFLLSRTKVLNHLLDTKELLPTSIENHPLARSYSAELFRRMLYRQLTNSNSSSVTPSHKSNTTTKTNARILATKRSRYRSIHRDRKTERVYFTKYTNDLKTSRAVTQLERVPESPVLNHGLVRITKRRECAICRHEFRKMQLEKHISSSYQRRRPKLTQYECTTCSPPIALCGPASSSSLCFQEWHCTTTTTR